MRFGFQITVSGGSTLPDFVYTPTNPLSQLLLYTYFDANGQPVHGAAGPDQ